MSLKRLLGFLIIPVVLLTTGAGCGGGQTAQTQEEITLKYWRVFDDEDSFESIIKAYELMHPNVDIEYRKLRPEEYEAELVRALAEGRGPDIFSVHNTKMGEYKGLIEPMPNSVNVSYLVTKGGLKKETVLEARTEPTVSMRAFKERFLDAVVEDAIMRYQPDPEQPAADRVFGLPLAVDTLALFSNRQLLNAAGIPTPPVAWEEFLDDVIKLTQYDNGGSILQSAAALGTTNNVERAVDILSVLMMQNGAEMVDGAGRIAFHTIPEGTPDGVFPGLDAVRFYTDFANPTKEAYTWNEEFPNSFEAFANGETAFFFGYSYHIPLLRSAAPKLDYMISKLPQISGGREVNYANYWLETVSKSSKHKDFAWHFLLFASNPENVGSYLEAANKPTAVRGLIETQLEHERLGVFAEQLLTARTWYRGKDAPAMESAMKRLADEILKGTSEPEEFIAQIANVVSQTY